LNRIKKKKISRRALNKNRKRLYNLVILALVVILGVALRVYDLGGKSLWTDEVASVRDSESTTSMIKGAQPPLYYFVLYLFRYMGTNEVILRLPSVIFGILTIALVYKVGKIFFGTKEGLIGAFLLSISTFHVYYSQEARMYTLLALLSLLSFYFFYKSIKENRKTLWFGFILSTLLTLLTHYFGVIVMFVEVVIFILIITQESLPIKTKIKAESKVIRKKTFLIFILSIMIISMLTLPFFWKEMNRLISRLVPDTQDTLNSSVQPLEFSFIVKVFSEFSGGSPFSHGGPLFYLYLFFFLCGCILSVKQYKKRLVLMLSWIVLPIPLLFLASTRLTVYSEPRYMIYVLPVYLLIISKGITSIPEYVLTVSTVKASLKSLIPARNHKIRYVAILFIVAVFLGSSITPLWGYYNEEKRDWRSVATYLEAKSQVDDVIVVDPSYFMLPFSYYFNNPKNVSVQMTHGSVSALETIYYRNSKVWFVTLPSQRMTEMIEWLNQHSLWEKTFEGDLRVYFISQLPPAQSEAAIFTNLAVSQSYISWWETILTSAGVSTTTFGDAIKISSVNLSEFDLVVFIDIKRPFDEGERDYLQESIDNGMTVIISGLSPYWIAGGKTDLASISEWFGATVFSEASSKEKWGTRFTADATEIMESLDVSREYAFYTESDWSTPTATAAEPESVVYAYRENDEKSTIFVHNFGKGTIIFNGVRYGFWSPDADVFQQFFRDLVRSIIPAQ